MEGVEEVIQAAVAAEGVMAMASSPPPVDILEVVEPSARMKAEMRMATKTPSEWLRLLCRDWSLENESIVTATDARFLHYKSYLKGRLTSQLLCRLSISGNEATNANAAANANPHDPAAVAAAVAASQSIDFWKILGVDDEFDRAHIVANIERFCSLYNIRGGTMDEPSAPSPTQYLTQAVAATSPVPASANDGAYNNHYYPEPLNATQVVDPALTAAAAAAAAGLSDNYHGNSLLYPMDTTGTMTVNSAATAKRVRQTQAHKSEQRRLKAEMREREREAYSVRKAAEKAARLAKREESRRRKLAMRRQREEFAQAQKEAALRRAAELVQSNRVPIEITRGAAAAQAAANAAVANAAVPAAEAAAEQMNLVPAPATVVAAAQATAALPARRGRSSIVISTASDLDQIVTHSNNLWAKYNAIAKEHNQKVNWIVVAKELGIHVKVREKYARMHARAKSRGFDFVNWGHYRIKDYPQYFLDPLGPTGSPIEPAKIGEYGKPESLSGVATPLYQQQFLQPMPASESPPLQGQFMAPNAAEAGAMQQHAPVDPMVSLAAEAAGVVGGGAGFSSNQAVIAAAAAVQQHEHGQFQPAEETVDDMTHIIPALPPPAPADNNNNMAMVVMRSEVDMNMPDLGSTTEVMPNVSPATEV